MDFFSIRINIDGQPEVFYQFSQFDFLVVKPLMPEFPPESEGLGVVDLVSAPFSFSL